MVLNTPRGIIRPINAPHNVHHNSEEDVSILLEATSADCQWTVSEIN